MSESKQDFKLNLPEVIGSYISDGVEKNYTKEMLRGDIALLTLDMGTIVIDYMKKHGYEDVYLTPLITEITKAGINFANIYK